MISFNDAMNKATHCATEAQRKATQGDYAGSEAFSRAGMVWTEIAHLIPEPPRPPVNTPD